MQKKTLFAFLAMLAISMPAVALELPPDSKPLFGKSSTAYSSSYEFNSLLGAYGLKLDPAAVSEVPTSYAKVSGGKVVFNRKSIAYTPTDYHKILNAYGVDLSKDAVDAKLGGLSYAKIKKDKIAFSKVPTAYSRDEWSTILGAYALPVVAAPPPPAPAPAPAPPKPADSDGDGVIDANDACPGTPKGVAVDMRGCWAMSSAMLFDVNSAVIKPGFTSELDSTKRIFDAYPTMKVQIDGHADSTGADSYNQSLSEKRAKAVMNYLVNTVGIDASRLKAVGYGESRPAASNDTKEGRAKNRRVEFTPMI